MTAIPRPALVLGLAGLLPFAWGAATSLPGLALPDRDWLGARFLAQQVLIGYGIVILCFMSGVLWGFAARNGASGGNYLLSVLPALWAFFAVAGDSWQAIPALMAGFAGLLGLDHAFWRRELAPPWWMRLRLMLTAAVLLCLLVGLLAA